MFDFFLTNKEIYTKMFQELLDSFYFALKKTL